MFIGDRYCHLSGAFALQQGDKWRAGYGFEGLLKGDYPDADAAKVAALKYAEAKQ